MEKSYLFKIWQIHATVLSYLKARRLRLREPRVFCFLRHGFWTWIYMGTDSVVFLSKNTDIFRGQRFGINLPLNFDSRSSMSVESSSSGSGVDRTMYRMPLLQMQSLADHSTHFRATCNFPTHGVKKTDYARDKLKNHDFFGTFSYQCLHYEYINIRWGTSVVKTAQQQQSRET